MLDAVTRGDSATEDVCRSYTDETPVTLGMLLEIVRAVHRQRHMPDAPPSLACAYVEAIEDLIPNPWSGE